MKNILNKFSYLSLFLALGLVITSCSNDDDTGGSDASKVIPVINALNGNTVAYVGDTYTYTLQPYRGGSSYNWEVTGASMQPVEGRPDQIMVTFTQFQQPVSVSVSETAANGSTSEVMSQMITVFGAPCDWTVDMEDAWGDGWNGASVTFTFEGTVLGTYTLSSGSSGSVTVPVPDGGDVTVSFTSGSYDEEVTYYVYDASGTLVFEDGVYVDGLDPTAGNVYTGTNACP